MDPRRRSFASPCLLSPIALALLALVSVARAYELDTAAKQLILMDAATGEVLIDKDGDAPMGPASMSKLMTVEIIFHALKTGRLKMDDTFHVSEAAWAMKKAGTEAGQGSMMYVNINDDIKVEDLLRGIIIQSGNDACLVIAEGLAGSDAAFADMMNKRAKELGLKGSHFVNSYGWPDPQEYVTAGDLAILARHLITDYPEYYPMFAEREFTWEKIRQYNRNPLLGSSINADGLKTGHTEASGFGLVASAVKDAQRLILVVNGLESEAQRKNESMRLLQLGFREFDPYKLLNANQIVAVAPVHGGTKTEVPLVVRDPVTRILSRDGRAGMKVTVDFSAPLKAPIAAGEEVGKLTIAVPGASATVAPVVTAEGVGRMGPLTAMGTGINHLLRGLMGESELPTAGQAATSGS